MATEDGKSSLDVLGIKPIGESVLKVTDGMVDGAAAFLSRICLPAAEEFGLLLRDRVRAWRTANMTRLVENAERDLQSERAHDDVHAHPRIVSTILEEGSWIDDSVVQDMWGGLLSSSCTQKGDDDSNLVFTTLLSNMTKIEARVFNFACERCDKKVTSSGLVVPAGLLRVTIDELRDITEESDVFRLDCELDHLRHVGLFADQESGFNISDPLLNAYLNPTPMGLQMYVRCQGTRKTPIEYFGLCLPESDDNSPEVESKQLGEP